MRNYLPLIVEDNPCAYLLLRDFLEKLPFFEKPLTCDTALEALKILKQNAVDILFLDINLPDMSGLELLKACPKPPPTIITSCDPSFAVESFDYDVADYLLKPFSFARMTRAVNRALEMEVASQSVADSNGIFLKVGRQLKRFQFNDISYVEAFGIYAKIYHHNQITVVNETITSLEQRLPKRYFVRVQKSYIINLDKVESIDTKNLQMGHAKIPIGLTYRDSLKGFWHLLEKN
ncbi:MAG: LytTR family DNA-binding domain-containing protein [Spirosomataceae bacterium]